MKDETTLKGFIVKCDANGVIEEILLDDYDFIQKGNRMLQLLDQGSFSKFLSFLSALKKDNKVLGWELNFKMGPLFLNFFIGGIYENAQMTIFGSTENRVAQLLHNEVMRINNEQTNKLRESLKKIAISSAHVNLQESTFSERTELNNEMANLQRELAKKNAELKEANTKLSTLNQLKNKFLGMAAHDLRNPLSVISYYSSFLLDPNNNPTLEEKQKFYKDIYSSSIFMLNLVEELLDLTKIESGEIKIQLQEVDLVQLISDCCSTNNILASNKKIKIDFLPTKVNHLVQCDQPKMIQVLNNFLSNAVKYSPEGTTVQVKMQEISPNTLKIEVIDQGLGIPTEELKNVFLPFKTTSVQATGGEKSTGLGLSIVAKIIEGHEGSYGVESEVGKGSTFWFTLPISADKFIPSIEKNEVPLTDNNTELREILGLKILVAEDDMMMGLIAKRNLNVHDYKVTLVQNGLEVLAAIAQEIPDLILMDVHMPKLDGLETTQKIRKSSNPSIANIPIIGLTGMGTGEEKETCLNVGMNYCLQKPIKQKDLLKTIYQLFQNR